MRIRERLDQLQLQYRHGMDRILTPERKQVIARIGRLARNGVIFLAATGTAGVGAAGAFDVVAHTLGERGLTQGFAWGAVSSSECIYAGFVASHETRPNEDVSLAMEPFVGDEVGSRWEFDLTGRPLWVGGRTFCFDDADLKDAGVLFEAKNGDVFGAREFYAVDSP